MITSTNSPKLSVTTNTISEFAEELSGVVDYDPKENLGEVP